MRKLIERIENSAKNENPAASRMFGKAPVLGAPKKPIGDTSLNIDQQKALESALGRNLTVIWGPPGTGKTYTIGTIAEQLHKLNRTVLVVSHTNNAVDQAIKHIAESMKEFLEQGAVIRLGEVKDPELISKYPEILLKYQVERQSRELVQLKDLLTLEKQELISESNNLNRDYS
jgi:signal recognition particle GTPase